MYSLENASKFPLKVDLFRRIELASSLDRGGGQAKATTA